MAVKAGTIPALKRPSTFLSPNGVWAVFLSLLDYRNKTMRDEYNFRLPSRQYLDAHTSSTSVKGDLTDGITKQVIHIELKFNKKLDTKGDSK